MREVTRTHKGIYGYIENNGKVMLIIKKRGPYTGMYDLPGGSPETGESEEETLQREIMEETGCHLTQYGKRKEQVVRYENFVEDDGRDGCLVHTGILFQCQIDGVPDINISDLDSDGALWIAKEKLNAENATPFVLFCMDYYG